jgi:hypothetical protein
MKLWSMLAAMMALVLVAVAPEASGGGGTPITACGQTVTTNAVLTQDLVCTGHGIVVGAAGIKIDLKGFTIRGDGDVSDNGVDDSAGFDDVSVKNGVIRSFGNGVLGITADRRRPDTGTAKTGSSSPVTVPRSNRRSAPATTPGSRCPAILRKSPRPRLQGTSSMGSTSRATKAR